MSLTVDVISDVVCPWCYVGKVKLLAAIELFKKANPNDEPPVVRWHPFQLNPDLAATGVERAEYVSKKFGDRAASVYERVKNVGLDVGIEFAFDKIQRQPNTRKAHSLIAACAQDPALQERMVQTLFDAYFINACDLTSDKVLEELALTAGLDGASITHALNSAEAVIEIEQADTQAREMGVQGVPFFVFNGRLAVSGAQQPETLVQAMQEACALT
jgi:predicted DsbA family dithiol-disulfide isomerase